MYMGVILTFYSQSAATACAPHVYGGDPVDQVIEDLHKLCSPCIWG